ncbi:transmembrane protein 232-like [Ciona intestinalis]
MPILKVPVVHKFGIISHSQRLELQQRLIRQSYNEPQESDKRQSYTNPLEVSEQFVHKYNASGIQEKEQLRDRADKMIQRSKRRCGYSTYGEGDHVDLPLAWSELAILAQCKGKLQEDCFDILCTTLDQAPLHEENIPTLFFLAESALYWLRTDILKQAFLRAAEVKLLKMAQLVFSRLLFHHLSGHLRGLAEFKTRLHTYLDGIKEHQSSYQSYPGVWLCVRFISRVGEIIIGPYSTKTVLKDDVNESVPALAACVFRALCLWNCVSTTNIGVKRTIVEMLLASQELSTNDWVDGYVAISILAEASKISSPALGCLQDLARGVRVTQTSEGRFETTIDHFPPPPINTAPETAPTRSGTDQNPPAPATSDKDELGKKIEDEMDGMMADINQTMGQSNEEITFVSESAHTVSVEQLNNSIHQLQLKKSSGNNMSPTFGIGSWCWETGYQYSQILADICLNAGTTDIMKVALLGKWQDADVTTFRAGAANPCVESCALVDMLEYRGAQPRGDIVEHMKKVDWTWKLRYGALSAISKLIHALQGNEMKHGLRSAAWSLMLAVQESPVSESRVLEAIRVAQVEFVNININNNPTTSVWKRIAESLSEIYLLPPPPPPPASRIGRVGPRNTPSPRKPQTPRSVKISRPTIKEELLIHTSVENTNPEFNTRTSLDLNRVIADQWRKEVMRQQKKEDSERIKEMKRERKEEEIREKEILEQRKEKLKGRPTANLAPYQI